MTSSLIPLTPLDVEQRLAAGRAILVDIREPDEFARRRIQGAVSHPLATLQAGDSFDAPDRDVVFTCRTGMRTGANGDRLAAHVTGQAYVLQGGVDAWAAAGLPTVDDRKAPLELMRQVQIGAGLLILIGLALALTVHPAFFALTACVGLGLSFAGFTGFCGMARLLAVMPWNRVGSR